MATPVVGHQTWLGVAKETTFNTAVAPTLFPGFRTWSPNAKNVSIKRANGKKRYGQSLSPGGPYDFSATWGIAADPDTMFPLLAWGFGAQTTPVLVAPSTTAYRSTLSFGATLPSFTLQEDRGIDAVDHTGCTIDTIKFTGAPGALLAVDLGIVAASEAINAAPATPSFSTIMPLHIDQTTATTVLLNGGALSSGTILKRWDIGLNNNLEKTYRGVGTRFVAGFPVGQRLATCGITLSFVDHTAYQLFLGAAAATTPQAGIAGMALAIPVASATMIDVPNLLPYSIVFTLPNMYPMSDLIAGKEYGSLEQTFAFDPAEAAGANNDLTAVITTAVAAAY